MSGAANGKKLMEWYVEIAQLGFLKFFTGTIAQPIRAFHLQVGHATVTGAVVIGFCAMAIGLSWTWMTFELNRDREAALVAQIEANTRRIRLDNALKSQSISLAPLPPWRVLAVSRSIEGVSFEFPAHSEADSVMIKYQVMPTASDSEIVEGIASFDISAQADSMALVLMASEQFGPAWADGNRIAFDLSQILVDKREQRYTGARRWVSVADPP